MALLRCPDCAATLRETGDGWHCTGCDAHGIVDAAGVLHLDLGPSGGAATGRAERVALDPETPSEVVPARISAAISDRAASSPAYWNYRSSFLPNPAGFAVLGATHAGTRSPLAARAGPTAGAASTLEVIPKAVGVKAEAVHRIDSHPNSNCLSFRNERHFVKIPVTRDAAARITNASRVLKDAPAHMSKDGFIGAPLPGIEAGGIPLGVYPVIPHEDPNTEWTDKVERVAHALDRLDGDRTDLPLGRTDFWRRLMEDEAREDLHRLSPELDVYGLLTGLEGKSVPSGLVHGDLAWGNLTRDPWGRVRLIDWDRCERQSPRFLDTVHACHSLARTHHFLKYPESRADRILEAWGWLLDRASEIPLLDRVDDVRGELGWKDVVALTILNEIDQHHRSLRGNPILRSAHHETLQKRLRLVLGNLGGS
jgi:hypothetical protein